MVEGGSATAVGEAAATAAQGDAGMAVPQAQRPSRGGEGAHALKQAREAAWRQWLADGLEPGGRYAEIYAFCHDVSVAVAAGVDGASAVPLA